jgi:hypothetical protein
LRPAFFLLLLASYCFAQDRGADSAVLELTASWWSVHTTGTIRASGTPVDFQSDLGVNQNAATFTGRLDVRFARRNWLRVEGTPFRLDGAQNLSESITYQGRVFSIADRITSTADLNYFYAGYQFDLISHPNGHFGVEAGGAYFNATGSISSQATGVTASKSETVGMPLAGLAFRSFPVHGKLDIEINGEVKGMNFGGYGHFVQVSANAGVGRGHFLVEGGYRFINADIHTTNGVTAVSPEFRGPVVSVLFRM